MLEPRRLATRAAARRMADLVGSDVGDLVGYQTRDERRIGPATRIEVLTEGVLTRRLQRDPELPGVAAVIFDEVHERNLPTDLGLALTLDVAATVRPDLRILAMSATADTARFARLLAAGGDDAAPVIVGGRTRPIRSTSAGSPGSATIGSTSAVERAVRRWRWPRTNRRRAGVPARHRRDHALPRPPCRRRSAATSTSARSPER